MESNEQSRSDEVRELFPSEAPALSEASTDQIAAEADQEAGHCELPPNYFRPSDPILQSDRSVHWLLQRVRADRDS